LYLPRDARGALAFLFTHLPVKLAASAHRQLDYDLRRQLKRFCARTSHNCGVYLFLFGPVNWQEHERKETLVMRSGRKFYGF
jgi:hypothetical protein